MLEIAEVRKRVQRVLRQAGEPTPERRADAARDARDLEQFLETVAVPVIRMVANVLRVEGHMFGVATPKGKVALFSERTADNFIEIELESGRGAATLIGRSSHRAGRQVVARERPLGAGQDPSALTDEDVLRFVLSELGPLVGRRD